MEQSQVKRSLTALARMAEAGQPVRVIDNNEAISMGTKDTDFVFRVDNDDEVKEVFESRMFDDGKYTCLCIIVPSAPFNQMLAGTE